MNRRPWLEARKLWNLQYAAFLGGLPTSGTKIELAKSLERAIAKPLEHGPQTRILSIDMGIRNLGLCVVEMSNPAGAGTEPKSEKMALRVVDWKKVDVLRQVMDIFGATEPEGEQNSKSGGKKSKNDGVSNLFTPSILSHVACSVTRDILERYKPNEILIERQRFRSSGTFGVQEWTLRVNMFESMLWACFRMLPSLSLTTDGSDKNASVPLLAEVSPARVADFWCSGSSAAARRVPSGLFSNDGDALGLWNSMERKKTAKKDKIEVVRSLLLEEDSEPGVQLHLGEEARKISDLFLIRPRRGGTKKAEQAPAARSESKKLDDLADSLLQAIAWVKWEENRRSMARLIDKNSLGKS